MKKPRKTGPRPRERRLSAPLAPELLADLAAYVRYAPSPYHKTGRIMGVTGQVRPAVQSSKCPQTWQTRSQATEALRQGIRQGLVSEVWSGAFPKHVWYKLGDTVYEAMLTNREDGTYHGYPLSEPREWPEGL
jgi:hypothetical protein